MLAKMELMVKSVYTSIPGPSGIELTF